MVKIGYLGYVQQESEIYFARYYNYANWSCDMQFGHWLSFQPLRMAVEKAPRAWMR
jgi:hypothetical protein